MRILFVHEAISPIGGGSQKAILTWIKNLKKEGLKIRLLCNQPTENSAFEDLTDDELIINKSINLSLLYPGFSIAPYLLPKIVKEIRQFNPQIIHLHEPLFISYQIHRLTKSLKIKTLASFHTSFINAKINRFPLSLLFTRNGLFNRAIEKIQFIFLQKSDYLTAPSRFYQRILSTNLGKKTFRLPYPIPDYFFQKNTRPSLKNINRLITVSRLSGEKNIDLLIQMMTYLKNRFTLTVVGEGVDKAVLEHKVKKLKLNRVIKFTGWVKSRNIVALLKNHHLFLSASNAETFGIVYIEALSVGIPCVVYDFPISKEVIPAGMGVFIKNLQPEDWAAKLIEIQDNPKIYQQLKQNINNHYHKIYQYHEFQSTKRLIDIYQKVLYD